MNALNFQDILTSYFYRSTKDVDKFSFNAKVARVYEVYKREELEMIVYYNKDNEVEVIFYSFKTRLVEGYLYF